MLGKLLAFEGPGRGPVSATTLWRPGEAHRSVAVAGESFQQCNVLRRHPDGSIATAVTTWLQESLDVISTSLEFLPDAPMPAPEPMLRIDPNLLGELYFGVELTDDEGVPWRCWVGPDAGLQIAKVALLSGVFSTWHEGSVMEEVEWRFPLRSIYDQESPIRVVARWRLYGDKAPFARIEVALENGAWTQREEPRFKRLKVFGSGAEWVLHNGCFFLSTHCRFEWWVGNQPPSRLAFMSPSELVDRMLVPPLNLAVPLSDAEAYSELKTKIEGLDPDNADGRPFFSGPVYNSMGGTGDRHDIGWIPHWGVVALQSNNELAWNVLREADRNGIGAFPIFPKAGPNFVRFLRHDDPEVPREAINWTGEEKNPNRPDGAHHPNVGWLSFLTRGAEKFDAETLEGSSTYTTLIRWPYRGRMYENTAGRREGAWTLRSLVQAATYLPGSLPNTPYLDAALDASLEYFDSHRTSHPLTLWDRGDHYASAREPMPCSRQVPPWQHGWWTMMLRFAWEHRPASVAAKNLFEFSAKVLVDCTEPQQYFGPDQKTYDWRPPWMFKYQVATTVFTPRYNPEKERLEIVEGTERDIKTLAEMLYYTAVGESNSIPYGELPPPEFDGLPPEDFRIADGYVFTDPKSYWMVYTMEEIAPLFARLGVSMKLWEMLLPHLEHERDRGEKREGIWFVP